MPVNEKIIATSGTKIQLGGIRLLTIGEIALARMLYGSNIRYNEVWIHRESYLPFNLQPLTTAMSPNGEMWFREETYSHDFFMDSLEMKHLFIHEMMHVWQAQHGMYVRIRGLFSRFADYYYKLDKGNLFNYGLEQQASIVSDYWLLCNHGFKGHENLYKYRDYSVSEPAPFLMAKYKSILKGFPA